MKFLARVPDRSGYYWVINKSFPEPFPAYVWTDVRYPFCHRMSAPCRPEEEWMGEHKEYRFGDKLSMPKGNQVDP